MMATATIRDNCLLLKEDRLMTEDRPHQRALSKLNPAPHLLLREHCHPSGTRDSLEDLDLPPDQNSTSLVPLESKRKHRQQQKQTMRSK